MADSNKLVARSYAVFFLARTFKGRPRALLPCTTNQCSVHSLSKLDSFLSPQLMSGDAALTSADFSILTSLKVHVQKEKNELSTEMYGYQYVASSSLKAQAFGVVLCTCDGYTSQIKTPAKGRRPDCHDRLQSHCNGFMTNRAELATLASHWP